LRRKGGKASGRARRKKADFKKAAETILQLELPQDNEIRDILEEHGIEPTYENALIFSCTFKSVVRGDINAMMSLLKVTGQAETEGDKAEQSARIEKLKADTEKVKTEIKLATQTDEDANQPVTNFMEALAGAVDIEGIYNDPAE
ncbi:MAG TPA: hypothetical protein VFD14_00655, partial [Clostridia bacterium]|nr:hypothetical protein [Clostridia bacterium]